MAGLWVLAGLGALVCAIILPILTYGAVRALRERLDALEPALLRELRLLREALAEVRAARPLHGETPPCDAPAAPSGLENDNAVRADEAGAAAPLPPAAVNVPAVLPVSVCTPPPLAAKPANPAAPLSDTDSAGTRLLRRMWNWIVVGEEYRRPGLSAEFAVATTWLIRSGVLIAVFAVGFGLQLSISRGLLGPAGRVALSLLCGSAFVITGLRCLCKRYHTLGQGFVGGGLAMFYFAFYAGSMMFGILPVSWAFACMAAVTASAVVLAVRLNTLTVAVLGALGGYLTPLVLKSAQPDLALLDLYLTVLALGMAGVAVWRQWPLLTWLSLVFNSLLFLAAAGCRCNWHAGQGTWQEIVYVCVFFAIYSTAVFIHGVRKQVPSTFVEVAALFVNASVTLGCGALLIGYGPTQRTHLSVLALGIAAFYVAHIWILISRGRFDRVLLSAFCGLAVVFLGVALPLLFTGQVLSAMFALQAVALLWLGRRLESRVFTVGALCFFGVVVVRLASGLAGGPFLVPDAPGAYWTGLKDRLAEFVLPIAALFAGARLFRNPPVAARKGVGDLAMRDPKAFHDGLVVFIAVFYAAVIIYATRELCALSATYLPCAKQSAVTVLWGLFAGHLLLARRRLAASTFKRLLTLAVLLLGAQWLVFGWSGAAYPVLDQLRHAAPFTSATALPRLVATLVCLAVLLGARGSLAGAPEDVAWRRLLLVAALVAGFLYITFETATCCTAYVKAFRTGAVSLVWGVYGLSLLLGGLRFGSRGLRMSGLALFCVTVAKVFLVDLAGLDVLYRLIAFGALGGVLLLAAFAYLKNQACFQKAPSSGAEDEP